MVLYGVNSLAAFLFVHDRLSWTIFSIVGTFPGVLWAISFAALGMKIFHPEKFGQFSSGLNVFGCGGLIVGNLLLGKLLDLAGSNYRLTFLWMAVLMAVAAVFYDAHVFCLAKGWGSRRLSAPAFSRGVMSR